MHLFVIESNLGVGENKEHLGFFLSMDHDFMRRDVYIHSLEEVQEVLIMILLLPQKRLRAFNARKKIGRQVCCAHGINQSKKGNNIELPLYVFSCMGLDQFNQMELCAYRTRMRAMFLGKL